MFITKCLLFSLLIKTSFTGFFGDNYNFNVYRKPKPTRINCIGFGYMRFGFNCKEFDKEIQEMKGMKNEMKKFFITGFHGIFGRKKYSTMPPMTTTDEYGMNEMDFNGGGSYTKPPMTMPTTTTTTELPSLYSLIPEDEDVEFAPKITTECGQTKIEPTSRVVGGHPAKEMEFPWQIGIQRIDTDADNKEVFLIRGGGAILNNRWVLTAAHVFNDVQLNETRGIYGTISSTNPRKTIKFDKIITHKDYDVRTFTNDIALLRVAEDMNLFPNETTVNAICLPESKTYGGMAIVTGWGLTNTEPQSESPDTLMGATLQVVDDELCTKLYPTYNSSIMLCAGEPKGEKDSCDGDSGGPLFVYRQQRGVIIGIVSFGQPRTCGKKGTAAVYTRVAKFVDWINNIISINS